ncbi:MAG: hypothetical protein ACRCZJ_03660 [Erysipelotrichaceae bacterium]
MIKIMAPLKRKEIKTLLDTSDLGLTFIKEEQMALFYETEHANEVQSRVKELIKAAPFGQAIMFRVEVL